MLVVKNIQLSSSFHATRSHRPVRGEEQAAERRPDQQDAARPGMLDRRQDRLQASVPGSHDVGDLMP